MLAVVVVGVYSTGSHAALNPIIIIERRRRINAEIKYLLMLLSE